MFDEYYKTELDYLHQLCTELGRRFPRIAPMLGRDADPSVSRLLQSLAFSFGRLRQRLDDDLPEIIHPVIETLCPDLLRPLPSTTVMELTPDPGLAGPESTPAGSVFGARPVDGVSCLFESTEACTVRPWRLVRVEVASDRLELRIAIEVLAGATLPATAGGPLRLFFALPTPMALELRSRLLRGVAAVTARQPSGGAEVALGGPVPAAWDSGPSWRAGAGAAALLRLRAAFAWPEQFASIEIPETDSLRGFGDAARGFEVVFRLREPLPRAVQLDVSHVRLHTVPARNVFRPPPLQLSLDQKLRRCRILFDDPDAELFTVEKVALVRASLAAESVQAWAPLVPPPIRADGRPPLFYRVHRAPSVRERAVDSSVSFVSAETDEWLARVTGVDLAVRATHGARAARVGLGDVCIRTPQSPPLMSFRNITPVSRSAPPALDGDRLWRCFQFVKASFPQVANAEYLASVLALANLPAWAQWPDAKADADRFQPLLRVRRTREKAALGSDVFAGADVEIDFDMNHFSGVGEMDMLGECLAPLLASTVRSHEWIQLALCDERGARLVEYPRLFGTRRGL